jgi:formin 2
LRKHAVNPPRPMKPLYWTRIVAPIKSTDVVDALSEKKMEDVKTSEEELWQKIDETKLDNLDEFTELFSRQTVVVKTKESAPAPKIKAIKVLDSKRSQNVGIFVRSIGHIDFAEIEHAIYNCDTSIVSLDILHYIKDIKATTDEIALIKDAIAQCSNDTPLDVPESWLLKLSQVNSSSERIHCIVFQSEFEESCVLVSRKISLVKSLSEFLLFNENLKQLFSIILTLGNFMNGGNRQR